MPKMGNGSLAKGPKVINLSPVPWGGEILGTGGKFAIDRRRAPRPGGRFLRRAITAGILAAASPGLAQDRDPMVIADKGPITLRAHLQGGTNAVAETNLFWNLSDTFAPEAGFDPDTQWLELYVKPGLSFATNGDGPLSVYGKLSAVASYTQGTDAFDATDQGVILFEEAYLGIRTQTRGGVEFDLSLGARELSLGTGMLIANGGANGFERGALKLGPRKAWDLAAIGKVSKSGTAFTGFFLSPNERPEIENNNRLAGFDLRHDFKSGGNIGATFVAVTRSDTPYPQAAPNGVGAPRVLPGAREDTNTIGLYGRTGTLSGPFENWLFAIDFAYQWNDRIDLSAWAGRVQLGYTFANARWRPSITYSYQSFSGDDPDTPGLERFDPLFYEGSPSAWATGSKASMVYINSNVQAHSVALRVQPSRRDTLTLRYAHLRANELRSPLQFGQAARVDLTSGIDPANIVAGVTDAHLSDDLFLEYSRVITPNLYLTVGLSVADPGDGNNTLVPGGVPEWTGGFVNVVFNF